MKHPSRGYKRPPAGLEALLAPLRLVPLDMEIPDLEQDEGVKEMTAEYHRKSEELNRRLRARPYRPRWHRYLQASSSNGPDLEELISKDDWPTFQANKVAEAKGELDRLEAGHRAAYIRKKFDALWRFASSERLEGFAEYILGCQSDVDKTAAPASRNRRVRSSSLPSDLPKTFSLDQIQTAFARYYQFRFRHSFMKTVVRMAASRKAVGGATETMRGLLGSWYIDEHDHFQPVFNPIVQVLDDDKLEISRIRMCANENCRRIFWAGNVKQSGCTAQCSAAQHSRKSYRIHRQPKTERSKVKRVIDAIPEGALVTAKAVAKDTGLSFKEVSRLATKLFEVGRLEVEQVKGQLQYSRKVT